MQVDLTGTRFVENLRYLRKRYALSRRALARLTGISEVKLRYIEQGKLYPVMTEGQLKRICRVFDRKAEDMIHRNLKKET